MDEKRAIGIKVDGPTRENSEAFMEAVQAVLGSPAGDAVKIAALEAIRHGLGVSLAVSGSTFNIA